jgi:Flp pilus assembly protein TadG
MRCGTNRGSMTVEVLLLTPALFMFSLVSVFAMRLTDSQSRTQSAADVAARVASQSSNRTMLSRGYSAAYADLSRGGLKCNALTVDIVRATVRGMSAVTAEVKCNVDLSGLSLLGLSRHVVVAQSTEVIDVYRSR